MEYIYELNCIQVDWEDIEEAISNAVYDSEDILDEYVFDNTLQEEYETFELYGRAVIEKLMYELDMTDQVLLPNKAYVRQYKEDDYQGMYPDMWEEDE